MEELLEGVLKGDRKSIARTISLVEDNSSEAKKIISKLYPHGGKAHVIGVTGPGGSGKSTLIEKLTKELRRKGKTVGVIAVDPTSPFTGGAFLGDRIRMQDLSLDPGVFIRSMATRNAPGGLAKATKKVVQVLDASGKDFVMVETVGAGQSEVEVVKIAHTIVVVLSPDFGDEIQAIKAGIMEIGDIFVVNKADRENADKAVISLSAALELSAEKSGWKPPFVKTNALTGEGTTELLEAIDKHWEFLKAGALEEKLRRNIEMEVVEAIKHEMAESVIEELRLKGELEKLVGKIMARETDPYSVAKELLNKKLHKIE
jgi:LAO/AO transport system kinase